MQGPDARHASVTALVPSVVARGVGDQTDRVALDVDRPELREGAPSVQRGAIREDRTVERDVVDPEAVLEDAAVGDDPERDHDGLSRVGGQVAERAHEPARLAVEGRAERRLALHHAVTQDRGVRGAVVGGHLDVAVVEARLQAPVGVERQLRCPRGDGDLLHDRPVQVVSGPGEQRGVGRLTRRVRIHDPLDRQGRELLHTVEADPVDLLRLQVSAGVPEPDVVRPVRRCPRCRVRLGGVPVDRGIQGRDPEVRPAPALELGPVVQDAVQRGGRRPRVDQLADRHRAARVVHEPLHALEPVGGVVVQGGHEVRAEPIGEELHHRVGGAVVAEDLPLEVVLVPPQVQRVLGPAVPWDRIELRLDPQPSEEALDVAVRPEVRDRDARVHVARERLGPVGQALVHPGRLAGVHVVQQQVLVLVGEDSLVQERPRRRARAQVGGRLVRRVRTRAVEPVERVDRHDETVDEVVHAGGVEPGDVREAVRVVRVVEVAVTNVVHEGDDVVTVAVPVVVGQAGRGSGRARAVARRRHAEGVRLQRVDVPVELLDQRVHLGVGDLGARSVAAVTGGEVRARRDPVVRLAGDPDLDVVPDPAERVLLQVEARELVQREPRLSCRRSQRGLAG